MKTNKKLVTSTVYKNVVKYFVTIALLVRLNPHLGEENKMEWKVMKRIIFKNIILFPYLRFLMEEMENSFNCLGV